MEGSRQTAGVAVVGTGWGTRIQVPAFRHAGLEVTALWGRRRSKAERIAEELGVPFATDELEEILGRPEVALVSLVVPTHLHRPMALRTLEAGRHLLCEKPTALDAGEAREMQGAAAARPHLLALVDHELRFLPALGEMFRRLRAGWVGEPLAADASWSSGGRLASGWRWSWWSRAERGGGILGAVGSHLVDGLRWLTGWEIAGVRADLVTALPERRDADGALRPVTSDERAALHLRFDCGLAGTIHLDCVAAGPPVLRLAVSGRRGRLVYEGGGEGGRLIGWRPGSLTPRELAPGHGGPPPEGLPDHEWARGTVRLAAALRAFLATGDREPLAPAATLADGTRVQEVLDAARRSARDGRWITPGAAG